MKDSPQSDLAICLHKEANAWPFNCCEAGYTVNLCCVLLRHLGLYCWL